MLVSRAAQAPHARETARAKKMLHLTEKLMSDLKDSVENTKDGTTFQ